MESEKSIFEKHKDTEALIQMLLREAREGTLKVKPGREYNQDADAYVIEVDTTPVTLLVLQPCQGLGDKYASYCLRMLCNGQSILLSEENSEIGTDQKNDLAELWGYASRKNVAQTDFVTATIQKAVGHLKEREYILTTLGELLQARDCILIQDIFRPRQEKVLKAFITLLEENASYLITDMNSKRRIENLAMWTISIISCTTRNPNGRVFLHTSEDISVSGNNNRYTGDYEVLSLLHSPLHLIANASCNWCSDIRAHNETLSDEEALVKTGALLLMFVMKRFIT